jgi:DNA-damage-inducible protein D
MAMSKEIEKARFSCFNSENHIGDHFGDVTEMVSLGSGAKRPVRTIEKQHT